MFQLVAQMQCSPLDRVFAGLRSRLLHIILMKSILKSQNSISNVFALRLVGGKANNDSIGMMKCRLQSIVHKVIVGRPLECHQPGGCVHIFSMGNSKPPSHRIPRHGIQCPLPLLKHFSDGGRRIRNVILERG